jgi:hypothetical protein
MDRIAHPGIESFKRRVMGTTIHGVTIAQWNALLSRGDDAAIKIALERQFDIRDEDAEKLLC